MLIKQNKEFLLYQVHSIEKYTYHMEKVPTHPCMQILTHSSWIPMAFPKSSR